MADRNGLDLPYGHFGRPTYDPEEQVWRFERDSSPGLVIRALGRPVPVEGLTATSSSQNPSHQAESPLAQDPVTSAPISRARHEHQIQDLVKCMPELQPAATLLPDLLLISEEVEAAIAEYNPCEDQLLAIGTVYDRASKRSVRIAAFPCGESVGDLKLVEIRTQRQGWAPGARDSSRGGASNASPRWIDVPTLSGRQAIWHGPGAPLEQITFASAAEGLDSFLAVRLPTCVKIFWPYARTRAHNTSERLLVPNLIFTIESASGTAESAASAPFAHVSFNPWYTRQVAVIDYDGCWDVWELGGKDASRGKLISSGTIQEDHSIHESVRGDGLNDWAHIVWLHDPETLLVCNRKMVVLHDLCKKRQPSTVIDLSDSSSKILDVAVLESRLSWFYVLTSTHLMVYMAPQASVIIPNKNQAEGAKVVVNLRHYGNPNDSALRCTTLVMNDHVSFFLHPRRGTGDAIDESRATTMVFSMTLGPEVSLTATSCPSQVSSNVLPPATRSVCLLRVPQGQGKVNDEADVTEEPDQDADSTHNVQFWCAFTLDGSRVLKQTLLSVGPVSESQPTTFVWDKLPVATRRPRKPGFIAEDAEEDRPQPENERAGVQMLPRRPAKYETRRAGTEWTISLDHLATLVEDAQANFSPSAAGVDAMLDSIERLLRESSMEEVVPWKTLLDMQSIFDGNQPRPASSTANLDHISHRLESLLLAASASHEDEGTQQVVSGEDLAYIPHVIIVRPLSTWSPLRLSELRARLVEDWITALPARLRGQVSAERQQVVNIVALELSLASIIICPQARATQQGLAQQHRHDMSDASARREAVAPSLDASSQAPASQMSQLLAATATLSRSATPSASRSTASGVSSHPSTLTVTPAYEIARLGQYTTFTKPPHGALGRSITRVLSHWEVGADPSAYDWRSVGRRVSQRDQETYADEGLTEKERARLKRRAERHLRRERREAAASAAIRETMERAPAVMVSAIQPREQGQITASQPMGLKLAEGSQGQSQGLGFPSAASQVVSGRYGGRPPAKKKRKQGF